MIIQFTLQQLMVFLVCAVGITAGILLIPTLLNIKKMTGIMRSLVETNQEGLKTTMKTWPIICTNVEQISDDVKEMTDKLKVSVPVIIEDVGSIAHDAKGSVESVSVVIDNMGSGAQDVIEQKSETGFMAIVHIIQEVLQFINRTFSSSK